jgi:hypothetical protein
MPPQKLTPEIVAAAIAGFEAQKARIDGQIAALRAMLTGDPIPAATTAPAMKKRTMSAAVRRRMALGQKARWAKIRGESQSPAPPAPAPAKPKRKLSKEGRAAIAVAMKKRWAAKKSAS